MKAWRPHPITYVHRASRERQQAMIGRAPVCGLASILSESQHIAEQMSDSTITHLSQ